MRKNFLAGALLVLVALIGTALADGFDIKERFTTLVGGMVTRSLPTTATTNKHREVHLTGDQRLLTYGGNPSNSWTILHTPAVDTAATISKAAEAGMIHVARGFTATFSAGTAAPTAVVVNVALRDGATGAGTIKWQGQMSVPATAGIMSPPISFSNCYIQGTSNTAMTLEFSAAGGANTFENVSLVGETIPYVAD